MNNLEKYELKQEALTNTINLIENGNVRIQSQLINYVHQLFKTLNNVIPGHKMELFGSDSTVYQREAFIDIPKYVLQTLNIFEMKHSQLFIGLRDIIETSLKHPNIKNINEANDYCEDRVVTVVQFFEYFGDYYISSIIVTNEESTGTLYKCLNKEDFKVKVNQYFTSSSEYEDKTIIAKDIFKNETQASNYAKIPFDWKFEFNDLIYYDALNVESCTYEDVMSLIGKLEISYKLKK